MGSNNSKPNKVVPSNGRNDPAARETTESEMIAMGIGFLLQLRPKSIHAFVEALGANPTAMKVVVQLNQSLGFSKTIAQTLPQTTQVEAMLPPELENFHIIKETKTVAAVLTDPTFTAAQLAVQKAPTDPAALIHLRAAVSAGLVGVDPVHNQQGADNLGVAVL